MATIAQPSTMSLFLEMQFDGHTLATGTSFLVRRAGRVYLVTNRHNLRGRRNDNDQPLHPMGALPDAVVVHHNAAGRLGMWFTRTERLYDDADQPLWLEHPRLDGQVDAVALPLTDLNGVAVYDYDPWSPGAPLFVGVSDAVSIPGFPFGHRAGGNLAIWVQGAIASEPGVDLDNLPLLMIDSRTWPGSSGSPVIIYRSGGMVALDDGSTAAYNGPVWRFLGIYSGRISAESDLGHVWKAPAIAEIIDGQRRVS